MNIKSLVLNSTRVTVVGRVIKKYNLKILKNHKKILNFRIQDKTSAIQVCAFGSEAEKFVNTFSQYDVIQLKNFYVRMNKDSKRSENYEIHLNKFSDLIKKDIDEVIDEVPQLEMKNINLLNMNDDLKDYDAIYVIKGQLALFQWSVNLYTACSKCKKKVETLCLDEQCEGNMATIKQLIVNAEVCQGDKKSVRVTFFHEVAIEFFKLNEEDLKKEDNLVGEKCDTFHGTLVDLIVLYAGQDSKENPRYTVKNMNI